MFMELNAKLVGQPLVSQSLSIKSHKDSSDSCLAAPGIIKANSLGVFMFNAQSDISNAIPNNPTDLFDSRTMNVTPWDTDASSLSLAIAQGP